MEKRKEVEKMASVSKSGMIALVGRPNVGKSTLANALAGEKVSIVTSKPQTTRTRICAIVNRGTSQYVFLDTPGLHKAHNRLDEYMAEVVQQSVSGVDAAVLLVEPLPTIGAPEKELLKRLQMRKVPVILAINKIDTVKKEDLLTVISAYSSAYTLEAVVPLSAREGDGTETLLQVLEGYLPEGPHLFPDDVCTDQPERQICGEILREKLLLCLDKEVPHGAAVEITRFSEREDGLIEIDAVIYCEKESHKGIIIGKKGSMLKKIAGTARQDMEHFLDTKVFLQTWVKVKENWRDNVQLVHQFGYRDD